MGDDTLSRLETIRRKIDAKEGVSLGPCLSEEEIQDFEQENGILLPEEYRLFLQVVGDGNDDHTDGYYVILPLNGIEPDAEDLKNMALHPPIPMPIPLNEPFPLTEAVWYDYDGWPEEDDHTANGWLSVGVIGCGSEWILIVTGPERGNMWATGGEFYAPSSPRMGFLKWCELWVERGFDDGLSDLMVGPNDPPEAEDDSEQG